MATSLGTLYSMSRSWRYGLQKRQFKSPFWIMGFRLLRLSKRICGVGVEVICNAGLGGH